MIVSRKAMRFLIPTFAVAFAIQAGAAWASSEPQFDLADFEGNWNQVDLEATYASRFTSIERAVGGLSWVVRQMAAPVLHKTTAPPPRIQFIWDGKQLEQRVVAGNGEQRSRPVDLGTEDANGRDSRGAPMTALWAWTEAGLELAWTQNQAHGRNVYRVDSDGETLIVEHTIQVTAISNVAPIVFESRFARRALPEIAAPSRPNRSIEASAEP